MERIDLSLTENQARKLMSGKPIQLTYNQLSGNGNWLAVRPHTAKKVRKALQSGRGCRITLDNEEYDQSAEGLREFARKVGRKAKNFYNKKLKPTIGPLIKEGVKDLIKLGEAGLSTLAPELAPAIGWVDDRYADKFVDKIGSYTGLYGNGISFHPVIHSVGRGVDGMPLNLYSLEPTVNRWDYPGLPQKGGSFRPAGGAMRPF